MIIARNSCVVNNFEREIYEEERRAMADISKLPKEEQAAILVKREYYKKWRDNNKDRVKEHNRRYWIKKAQTAVKKN